MTLIVHNGKAGSPRLVLREAKNIKLKEFCGLKDRTIENARSEKALDR
ncbi:MAG: hypothetical protein UHS55_09200 [Prevotella sp.]|nr:hypothetical protein [Prevotella sp.]